MLLTLIYSASKYNVFIMYLKLQRDSRELALNIQQYTYEEIL